MDAPKYEITQSIAILSTEKSGWTRPGFPAVWVAFPGHVGPGFTAKGLSVSSIDHYGIARR